MFIIKTDVVFTLAYRISKFSLGIRTFSNLRYPLSMALKPILFPISPTDTPKIHFCKNVSHEI